MRRKLLVGGLGVITALLIPTLGTTASPQALSCPGAAATACGAVDLVVGTACGTGVPTLPSVPGVTVEVDGGPLLICPALPV